MSLAEQLLGSGNCNPTGETIVSSEQNLSLYELLAVSHSAKREEIDQACMNLWYRHRSMRGTPLWKDLNQQIEAIRSTLLNPETRAIYDNFLLKKQSTNPAKPQEGATSEDQSNPDTGRYVEAEQIKNYLVKEPTAKLSNIRYPVALVPAILFNQMIDWMRPENWFEVQNIAWLVLFLFLATTCLLWSAFKLFRWKGPKVAEN